MKSGDTVTDGLGRTWTVGQLLGRGAWGRTWTVRDAQGRELVMKVPLSKGDLPPDAAGLLEGAAACAQEQGRLLERASLEGAIGFEGWVMTPSGPGFLMPRLSSSLERKLEAGMGVGEALDVAGAVARRLDEAAKKGFVHGNLRPANVLFDDVGRVFLTDWLTETGRRLRQALEAAAHAGNAWHPPEAARAEQPRSAWDTWAVCAMLYRVATFDPGAEPRRSARAPLPDHGLDRGALTLLREKAATRLGDDAANPRFVARVTQRLATLLNRGLSEPVEPSPPYRFDQPAELVDRIEEVREMVRPAVTEVSRVLLSSNANNGVYEAGQGVEFTVMVTTTRGVEAEQDLVCGLRLRDLDGPEDNRVPAHDSRFTIRQYPSRKWKFAFTIPEVPPGRYKVRCAFSVRDGSSAPLVGEGEFEVRPPPGYVPPPEAPPDAPAALPFRARGEPREHGGIDDRVNASLGVRPEPAELPYASLEPLEGPPSAPGPTAPAGVGGAWPAPIAPTTVTDPGEWLRDTRGAPQRPPPTLGVAPPPSVTPAPTYAAPAPAPAPPRPIPTPAPAPAPELPRPPQIGARTPPMPLPSLTPPDDLPTATGPLVDLPTFQEPDEAQVSLVGRLVASFQGLFGDNVTAFFGAVAVTILMMLLTLILVSAS